MSITTEKLLEYIWAPLVEGNVMEAMKMLKGDTRMYSEKELKFLREIAEAPFGGDEDDAPATKD